MAAIIGRFQSGQFSSFESKPDDPAKISSMTSLNELEESPEVSNQNYRFFSKNSMAFSEEEFDNLGSQSNLTFVQFRHHKETFLKILGIAKQDLKDVKKLVKKGVLGMQLYSELYGADYNSWIYDGPSCDENPDINSDPYLETELVSSESGSGRQ